MLSLLLRLFLLILFCTSRMSSLSLDRAYTASCIIASTSTPCQIALFSHYNFKIQGSIKYSNEMTTDTYCDHNPSDKKLMEGNEIAIAKRGVCNFDTKAKVATLRGFKGLLVVNFNESIFPMGSATENFQSSIPVLMVGPLDDIFKQSIMGCEKGETVNTCQSMYSIPVMLQYDRAPSAINVIDSHPPSSNETWKLTIRHIATIALGVVPIFLIITSHVDTTNTAFCIASRSIQVLAIIAIFVILRLATLRILLIDQSSGHPTYNHRETDELIFQELIQQVSKSFWDYSLGGKPILDQLRLSKENYDDPIFIHPPVFVYVSAFLQRTLHLSLPEISILFHTITCLSLYATTHNIFRGMPQRNEIGFDTTTHIHSIGLWSMVVYSFCPIAWFCSQKIWIDNCLIMTSMIAVCIHTYCCSRESYSLFLHFASGMVYGGLTLNTKITGLALLPFLLIWSMFHRIMYVTGHHSPQKSMIRDVRFLCLMDVLSHGFIFMLAVAATHGPWIYLYYSLTGRMLPNSWPSSSMIANSKFLQAAISHPWSYYFTQLVFLSPVTWFAFCFGFIQFSKTVMSTIKAAKSMLTGGPLGKYELGSVDLKPMEIMDFKIAILFLWPMSFLAGLTLLGWQGAGFQTRFLGPILPGLSLMAAIVVVLPRMPARDTTSDYSAVVACLLAYSSLNCVYYGIMFAPLYADLDVTVIDVICTILENIYFTPASQEKFEVVLKFMRHFGLNRQQS